MPTLFLREQWKSMIWLSDNMIVMLHWYPRNTTQKLFGLNIHIHRPSKTRITVTPMKAQWKPLSVLTSLPRIYTWDKENNKPKTHNIACSQNVVTVRGRQHCTVVSLGVAWKRKPSNKKFQPVYLQIHPYPFCGLDISPQKSWAGATSEDVQRRGSYVTH